MKTLRIDTPENFSFKNTIYSHGWSDLSPFILEKNHFKISYCVPGSESNSKESILFEINSSDDCDLIVETSDEEFEKQSAYINLIIKRMFRLNEDYSDFYSIAKSSDTFNWISEVSAGRMLRAGSLWEDMVKMLCTTNCTWRLTQIMVENLVDKLGASSRINYLKAFPTPQSIADKNEKYIRDEIKMGYRSQYLFDLACKVVTGELILSEFENKNISTAEIYSQLRSIKGFGDYAVSNLLKLLGRYDYLGADSWSRQKFADKYRNGKKCDDKEMMKMYHQFGKWAGLFFWMDVSEEWYKRDIPW